MKISHIDTKVFDYYIKQLNQRHGNWSPLGVTRGGLHEYLRMTIDVSKIDKFVIRMCDYVAEIL